MCRLLYWCVVLVPYLFPDVFLVFQGQRINLSYDLFNLISESLVCRLKPSIFFPNLYHPFPIRSLCWIAPKITVKYKSVVFPSLCFVLRSLFGVVTWVIVHVPEKRKANIHRMSIMSHMLVIRGTPADHDTHTSCLGPTWRYILIRHFTMSSILWLYQTERLFKIFAPDTDVTKFS